MFVIAAFISTFLLVYFSILHVRIDCLYHFNFLNGLPESPKTVSLFFSIRLISLGAPFMEYLADFFF